MDLTNFDTNAALKLHLCGPNGEPLYDGDSGEEVAIWVYGKYSKEYERYQREIVNNRVKKRMKGGRTRAPRMEENEADSCILMAKITTKWQHIVVDEELSCTYENARSLYEQFPWIREQIADLIDQGVDNLGE